MRIDRLEIENFKCFEKLSFDLHPQFTLFVGENGSGKSSVLDALAVAASVWLIEPPDSTLHGSRREIKPEEVRLQPQSSGDRSQFAEHLPVCVQATGRFDHIEGSRSWLQAYPEGPATREAFGLTAWGPTDKLLRDINLLFKHDANSGPGHANFPVVAYYSAGRAWSYKRAGSTKINGPARRWAAFQDCLSGQVNIDQLNVWFSREAVAYGNRGGRWRPGFEIVRRSILRCVPGSDDIWFDGDRGEIVLSIDRKPQPIGNLSAGQRMMMAMVADIAIKAVTQNAYLIPPDHLEPEDEPVSRLLQQTQGVVLIDELDVHLHPRWQRRVVRDLRETFPAIQFICTSHSPQVIGELAPEEIRMFYKDGVQAPPRSFGLDSNRVLEELMGAPTRDPGVETQLRELFKLIDAEDFDAAQKQIFVVEEQIGGDAPELSRARTLISFLQSTS